MTRHCANEHCGKVLKRTYAYQCCKNCLKKAKDKEAARQKKQEQAFANFMRACKPLDVDYAALRRDFAKNPELLEKWATITPEEIQHVNNTLSGAY